MPAYSITTVKVLDANGAKDYAKLTNDAVAKYGGRFLVQAALPKVVEGNWPPEQRVVIIEFPNMNQLETWYDSPEYAPAREIAKEALQRTLVFAEGIQPAQQNSPADAETRVRHFYEMMTTGDTSRVAELLAPGWEDIPLAPGISPGPEGYKQTVTFLRGVFPDLSVTIQDLVVSGDKVAARVHARGTHRSEFLGIPPTHQQVEFYAFDFHRLENGQIVQSWHLEDNFSILSQLGVTFTPKP